MMRGSEDVECIHAQPWGVRGVCVIENNSGK
jgi:hypothetical protein